MTSVQREIPPSHSSQTSSDRELQTSSISAPKVVPESSESCRKIGAKKSGCVWKCCIPLNPMVLLIIIPFLNGYNWEYILFSDKPKWCLLCLLEISGGFIGFIVDITTPTRFCVLVYTCLYYPMWLVRFIFPIQEYPLRPHYTHKQQHPPVLPSHFIKPLWATLQGPKLPHTVLTLKSRRRAKLSFFKCVHHIGEKFRHHPKTISSNGTMSF